MNLGLKGRVAIVTGGSKGIGKAIAKSLANEGVNVVICARGVESLVTVQEEIRQSGGNAVAVSADATDPKAVRNVITTAIGRFDGLDILVNNVGGIDRSADFLELTDDEWLEAFKLNVMPVVYFVRYALPWLRRSPAARIINISSISGVQPGSYNPHYTIVKAAVINLSKYLANQLAGDHILVNVVCPGPVRSHSWDSNVQRIGNARGIPFEEARVQVDTEETDKIPLGRIGEGDDVAGLVTLMASDKAAWITGSCFHLNGGKLRSMC